MDPSFAALLAASFSYPSVAALSLRTPFAEIFRASPVFSAVAIFRDSPTTKLLPRAAHFLNEQSIVTET